MPPSTTSHFSDINVWVALTYEGHVHHATAAEWFRALSPEATLLFCRFTQIGLLRLPTAKAVMGDEVMTQPQPWAIYDRWLQDPGITFVDEPGRPGGALAGPHEPSSAPTKDWADSFRAAFATI